ncbi:KaiC domain-containing protein [Halobacteriales archaeon QH_10_67_22]|nr:MAG: KaiC domain-containing protein [Halobacteriales archaeon QH_10_67_22]
MSEDDTADDDDWFESAFEDDGDPDAASERPDSVDDEQEATGPPDGTDIDSAFDEQRDDRSVDEPGDDGAETAEGSDGDTGGAFAGTGDSEGDNPFGNTGVEDDDPFGSSGGDDGFGDDGGSLFDDDFGEAMGSMGGGGDGNFDDEDLESDIPRLDIGIEGLDNMIQGGIPQRHLIVIVGGAGTGKTTFGLQFLHHGLTKDDTDKGVFITLEQTYEDIMATANERGWEFDRHEREDNLAVVDLDPVEMANSLDNIRGELPELIEEFDADRFVLDSVSLLEMMYDHQARRRTEVFDFTQSLKEAGVTTVFTSEAAEGNPYASRHGIIEYLTDAVFLLRYVRSETQETRLAVEIQKIRNANHSRETKPYDITFEGIAVYEQANIF